MLRILTILGTRPEAIKLAPVIRTMHTYAHRCIPLVCITSQHREMLFPVLELFDIKPQYNLNVMTRGHSLTDVTTRVLQRLEPILLETKPHLLLVQGDTTTSFAAALAAFYQKIKIGHIEAGLRTLDKYEPFPEEINRRVLSTLCDYHFAPTHKAKGNLIREGIDPLHIVVTGNTGIDTLFMTLEALKASSTRPKPLAKLLHHVSDKRILLVTAHRRENFGNNLQEICRALITIIDRNPDVHIVYPVHLNPNIHIPAHKFLQGHDRITLLGPLEYPTFVQLLASAYFVLTDSGGIQEEAPSLGKPVLVLRNVTERPEAIEAGTARLVGTDSSSIAHHAQLLLDNAAEYQRMSQIQNPFGDGHASQRIVEYIFNENL